jgi:hypothetical protein
MGILEKNTVNRRLCPTSKQDVTLTLILSTGETKKVEPQLEAAQA